MAGFPARVQHVTLADLQIVTRRGCGADRRATGVTTQRVQGAADAGLADHRQPVRQAALGSAAARAAVLLIQFVA